MIPTSMQNCCTKFVYLRIFRTLWLGIFRGSSSRLCPIPMFTTCRRCCLLLQRRGIRRQSTINTILHTKQPGENVSLTAWIKTRRKMKNVTFFDVTDGSTFRNLQIVSESRLTPETYPLF